MVIENNRGDNPLASAQPLTSAVDTENPGLNELPSQYELQCKISQGGMGAIYKAKNKYTDAIVAIKIMKLEATRKDKALARFIVEAKAAALLKHPRICQVHDFGLTQSQVPFLIMDYIDGIPLGQKIVRDGRMEPPEAIYMFQQITAGLEHAHTNKVVHRDLKPDNVMLTRDSDGRTVVHIVDFGIAKILTDDDETKENGSQLTSTGTFVGTPLFMSPEQARASIDIDQRSDIYSFGCMMYYVLAGEAPLVGNSAIDTIAKHLYQPPPEFPGRFKIPPDLRAIVFKCMEKDINDRYQTAAALSADLRKLTKGVGVKHRPLVHEREARRKRITRILFFVVGFAAMYAISIGMQGMLDSKPKTKTESANLSPPLTARSAAIKAARTIKQK